MTDDERCCDNCGNWFNEYAMREANAGLCLFPCWKDENPSLAFPTYPWEGQECRNWREI